MKIDITSMFFNSKIEGQTATPAWGTSIGQNKSKGCRIDDFKQEIVDMVIGMTYKSISDRENLDVSKGSSDRDIIICSVFKDVYINNQRIDNAQFVLLLVREHSKSHDGRLLISYAPYIKYNGVTNQDCINKMQSILGCNDNGCWFVYDISIKNQAELYFSAVVVNPTSPMIYSPSTSSRERSKEWKSMIPGDYEDFDTQSLLSESLQQIFYGAPGTGKSHTINEITEKQPKENVYRTTFHPDSDYSTFVGCYKPSMKRPEKIYTEKELTAKLKEIKESGVTYPCHKFATKYWESLKDLDAQSIKSILSACGFTDSMTVEVSKGIAIGQELLNATNDGKIVYDFSPQAFTKAYLRAWQTEDPVYLVIEEINRGNCAQIFGDLFQLLDRKNGFSEYPIKADNDLAAYIGEQLSKESREGVLETVKSGEELILPPNLYIWATMNTSDQSLFPIDSAFKRRWEWKYLPIENADKGWKIQVNGSVYDWYQFLEVVNREVFDLTHSEDKQLGYFFVKAKNNVVDAETLVNKVYFYLWTDVFKVYGIPSVIGSGKDWSFAKFYNPDGSVSETKVKELMSKLQIEPVTTTNPEDGTAEIESI